MDKCAACGKELNKPSITCPWCKTLLTNPEAGKLATERQRLIAFLIDAAIGLPVKLLAETYGAGNWAWLFPLGVQALAAWPDGCTIGKKLTNLAVFTTDGERATFSTMVLRETLGKAVSAVFLGLGYLWLLWDSNKQSLHDKIAGTVVVDWWDKGKGDE
ncbi:MAG: RDD family protein [Bacillota bacterium]